MIVPTNGRSWHSSFPVERPRCLPSACFGSRRRSPSRQAPRSNLEIPSHQTSDSIAVRRPRTPPVGPRFRSLASERQVVRFRLVLTTLRARHLNAGPPQELSGSSFLLKGISIRGDNRGASSVWCACKINSLVPLFSNTAQPKKSNKDSILPHRSISDLKTSPATLLFMPATADEPETRIWFQFVELAVEMMDRPS
jgi:hypothetical protein